MSTIWPDDKVQPSRYEGVMAIMDDRHKYFATTALITQKPNILRQNRVALTEYIRRSDEMVELTTENIQYIINTSARPPEHAIGDRLLLSLYDQGKAGNTFFLTLKRGLQDQPYSLMRAAGVADARALSKALASLAAKKLIEIRPAGDKTVVSLTKNGLSIARVMANALPARTPGGERGTQPDESGAAREAVAAASEAGRQAMPSAASVIDSAAWTGRRPIADQARTIAIYAPIAELAAQQLVEAIAARKLNEPEAMDAIDAIKALHAALGELIDAAENERLSKRLWKQYEAVRETALDHLFSYPQLFLSAPVVAVAMAHMLSIVSSYPMSEQMVTTLCAGGLITEAALRKRER